MSLIALTLTITRIPNKSFITYAFVNQIFYSKHLLLCLLLQTLASNLHLHLQVSCKSVCLVSFVLEIRLNTLMCHLFYNIRNTQFRIWIIDVVTTTTAFTCLILKTQVLYYWHLKFQLNEFKPVKDDENANPVKKHFLINPNIVLYYVILFH